VGGLASWLLFVALGVSSAPAASPFTLEVQVVGEAPTAVEGTLVLDRLDRPESSLQAPVRHPLRIPGQVKVPLPPGSRWQVHLEAEGLWSPPQRFIAGVGAEPLRLHAFPAAPLHGSLGGRTGTQMPREVTLRLSPPPKVELQARHRRSPLPAGEVRCPVLEEGGFRCPVPVGRHDLQISAPGFATEFRWDTPVEAGRGVELGTVRLRPGGSLVGSLVVEEGIPWRGIWVELSPLTRGADSHELEARLRSMVRAAVPDARGFFQIAGLPAGLYRLRAGGEGAAELELSPVEVFEGRESRLDAPLHLVPPLDLALVMEPPTTPRDEAWYVSLTPLEGTVNVWQLPPTRAQGDGILRRRDAVPGEYRLRVLDRFRNLWHTAEVEILPGQTLVEIELPLVEVEGQVMRGGYGVRSRLRLQRGPYGPKVSLYSGPEGELAGVVPEGLWEIHALLRPDGSWSQVGEVEVERPADGDPQWLAVELPGTTVSGVVVDRGGAPVEGSTVTAGGGAGRARATTDAEGRFLLEALAPGEYVLLASGAPAPADAGKMARMEITVAPDSLLEDLRLVLPETRTLQGRVLSPHGPLPGVQLWFRITTPVPRVVGPVTTGVTGVFEVDVPTATESLTLLVRPAGYGARLLRVDVGEAARLPDLAVDDFGGRVDLGPVPGEMPDIRWSLRQGDAEFPLYLVARPQGRQRAGERHWWIEQLAFGTYEVCGPARCESLVVPPQGTVNVFLPSSESSMETLGR
jgi:hypothetical protein